MSQLLAKAAKAVNDIKKSTLTTKKMESLFRKTVVSSHEKVVMKELVQILEVFEEATNLTQGDQYVSVSLVIPICCGATEVPASRRSSLSLISCDQIEDSTRQ